ncbi:olfactory receptor 1019-like [Xenopus tropicalis]|uniref:Olfactory receptor n=1 Tax=Xenopus tropicalis TaxID=8364 RepID=A0A8J1IPS4_XENTR|nr:olfactory receptor 1019-like [Xenopus tropicalis]
MDSNNQTVPKDFILLGLSNNPRVKRFLLIFFCFVYSTTLTSNCSLIILTSVIQELHSPMYMFICCLSLLDITFTSVTVPKMLVGLLSERCHISYNGCFTQLYFYHFLGCAECLLLSIMGYDRYVAICHPLHYPQIMNKNACIRLASSCWITGIIYSSVHTILTASLSFCRSREVSHFFCDMPPLLKISCSDTTINEIVILSLGGVVAGASFLLTVISYIYIISAILKIRSARGRKKAFSTCAAHLTVVSIFYGTIIIMYLRPQSSHSLQHDKMLSVFHNVITPMLNPLIYSLRNKDVKDSIRKLKAISYMFLDTKDSNNSGKMHCREIKFTMRIVALHATPPVDRTDDEKHGE